ncbi:hypothetical protein H0H92_000706 [Tricholoma furcatifolium]|nr:hypothetical protein H0H92_000706 [Tricholoma furcatifolium]
MSTRPGSGSSRAALPPAMNSKKRSSSDANTDENSIISKKPKTDIVVKDKKKKRRRRRKSSVVAAAGSESRERSKSRSVTVATESPVLEEVGIASPVEDVLRAQENGAEDAEDTSPRIPYADKGKGKAKENSLPPIIESPEAQVKRLQQELEAQHLLLKQHQTHLTQIQQALTCQICLDLLHKPFALAPCGHVVCHPCLIRWFTAPEEPNGPRGLEDNIQGASHCHKKKKCPICRAHITERPVEVWGIKDMVTGIVRSGLVELPAAIPAPEPEASTSTNDDPWHNIFRRSYRDHFLDLLEPRPPRPPRDDDEGLEDVGMYDAEDGGIYRCIDCMHEIWNGICTNCDREYRGHRDNDDDDEEDVEFGGAMVPDIQEILHMVMNGRNAFRHDTPSASEDGDGDEESTFGGEIDEGEGVRGNRVQLRRSRVPVRGFPRPLVEFLDEDEDDEDEDARIVDFDGSGDESEGYESSFIDDGESQSAIRSSNPASRSNQDTPWHLGTVNLDSEPPSEDEDVLEVPRRTGRIARLRASSEDPIVVSSDEGEDLSHRRIRALGRGRRIYVDSDLERSRDMDEDEDRDDGSEDEDEDRGYEDDGSRSRLSRIMHFDDEHDDDDEEEGNGWY